MTPIARVHFYSPAEYPPQSDLGSVLHPSFLSLSSSGFEAVEHLDRRRAVALGIVHPSCVSLSAARMLGSSPRLVARRL